LKKVAEKSIRYISFHPSEGIEDVEDAPEQMTITVRYTAPEVLNRYSAIVAILVLLNEECGLSI
jgi:hypothetical protein